MAQGAIVINVSEAYNEALYMQLYLYIILYIAYIYSGNVSCLFYIKISTVLITVHILFYHFCTVYGTRDLALLSDCIRHHFVCYSWSFPSAGFSACLSGSEALQQCPLLSHLCCLAQGRRALWCNYCIVIYQSYLEHR